jgi:hypothetical protein
MTPLTIIQPTFHEFFLHSIKAYYTNINSHTEKITPEWPHRCLSTIESIFYLRVSDTSYRHFTSCLTSYSHCIVTHHHHHHHHHIVPHHHNQPSQPSLPPHWHPTSSCTYIVLHIHICSMLKKAADPFEMFFPTDKVKRSVSILHPPPPHNKHNINYC